MPIDSIENYPRGQQDVGQTQMGMFLAWALLRGQAAEEYAEDLLPIVEARNGRPSDLTSSDGELFDEQFSDAAQAFAHHYYCPERYFEDFDEVVMAKAGIASPPDSWKAFDRLAAVLDERFAAFRS